MPPLSPPQTAYGLVYVGGPMARGKEQKRKAYSVADRSFADNDDQRLSYYVTNVVIFDILDY